MLQTFDERNRDLIVSVGGRLTHRDQAAVSPFDSAVQGGDAVWEGLRLHHGRIFLLTEHLARLRQSGPTLIVLPEYKPPVYGATGITLVTSSVRRPPPDCLDPKIHHANLLPSILAKIEANVAGADDALMLDQRGFVAETNATNVFCVTAGVLATPSAAACPEGITRAAVLELADHAGIGCAAGDLSLIQLYTADEVFVTGTMGGIAPVTGIDGRVIGDGRPGELTGRLTGLLADLTATAGTIVAADAGTSALPATPGPPGR